MPASYYTADRNGGRDGSRCTAARILNEDPTAGTERSVRWRRPRAERKQCSTNALALTVEVSHPTMAQEPRCMTRPTYTIPVDPRVFEMGTQIWIGAGAVKFLFPGCGHGRSSLLLRAAQTQQPSGLRPSSF